MKYLHQATFNHFFRGLSANLIDQHAEQFIQNQIKDLIYKPAYDQLRMAQKKGYYTAIFSASPDFLVGKIASYFQVNSWKSSLYQRDNRNNFSKITYVMEGDQKAESLTELMQELNLNKNEITAFSDSYLDLPLLTAVGYPVAVRPDKKLKAISLQKQWPIL
jgi:phosphoserine phosphatase